MTSVKTPTTSPDMQRWLSEATTAHRLGYSTDTLKRMAKRGEGPPRYRLSPRCVRYRADEVDRWVAERAGNAVA